MPQCLFTLLLTPSPSAYNACSGDHRSNALFALWALLHDRKPVCCSYVSLMISLVILDP